LRLRRKILGGCRRRSQSLITSCKRSDDSRHNFFTIKEAFLGSSNMALALAPLLLWRRHDNNRHEAAFTVDTPDMQTRNVHFFILLDLWLGCSVNIFTYAAKRALSHLPCFESSISSASLRTTYLYWTEVKVI